MTTNEQLIIREARKDDRDAIRTVTLAAYDQYERIMTPARWPVYYAHLLETLDSNDAPLIVAELDGVVVGSVRLVPPKPFGATSRQPGDDWPEISILAVAPDARGNGVARALVDECIRRARAAGATTLGLHTEEAMSVALDMYRRRGFVRAPEIDFYPEPGWHVMGFRLDLNETEL